MDVIGVAHSSMRALVAAFGCLDAAAEAINLRGRGGASKGTLSRKMSGSYDWSLVEVVALEDAAGQYPVTRLLARRLQDQAVPGPGSLISDSAGIAKESAEAIGAILAAAQSSRAAQTDDAIREVDEAIEALTVARARLETRHA